MVVVIVAVWGSDIVVWCGDATLCVLWDGVAMWGCCECGCILFMPAYIYFVVLWEYATLEISELGGCVRMWGCGWCEDFSYRAVGPV